MSSLTGLVQNLGVLALGALLLFLVGLSVGVRERRGAQDAVVGLVLGFVGFVVVLLPVYEPQGATFDSRAAPMLVAGLMGGPVGALVAASLGGLARALVGGPWIVGGVLSLYVYALVGLVAARAHRLRDGHRLGVRGFALLAAAGSVAVTPCFFVGRSLGAGLEVIASFWPVFLVHNVIATVLLGKLVEILLDFVAERDEIRSRLRMNELARDAAGVGFWRYDFRTGRLDWDQTQHMLLDVPRERYSSDMDAFLDLVHPDDREAVVRNFARCVASGSPYSGQLRLVPPKGGLRHIRTACAFVGGAPGRPDLAVGVVIDETKNRELLEDVALKGAALDQAICGIVVARAEGDHPTVYVNRAFTEMTGYAADEALGLNCRFLGEDLREENAEALQRIRRAAAGGEACEVTLRNRRKDGSLFWNRLSLAPIRDARGAVSHFIGVQDDVTGERAARDAIEAMAASLQAQLEVSEAANEAKGRFLAVMSHELRTPLNGVLGMVQLLEATPLDARQAGYVETALTCGRALLAIIDDILELAVLENRSSLVAQEPVDLARVMREASAAVAADAGRKGIAIEVEVAAPLRALRFLSDPYRIRQILINLLANALKFSEEGPVRVEAHVVDGDRLRIDVVDRGIGIPEQALATIFDRFTQVDQSMTRRHGGAGLGLAICREVAELLGGEMAVRSVPGRGSTFSLVLPLRLGEPQAASARAGREAAADGPLVAGKDQERPQGEVVVVDDDAASAEVVSALSRSIGLAVRVYADAATALREAEGWRGPIVVTDLRMPGLGGEGLIRALRARPDLAAAPVAVVTADARLRGEDARRLGADAFFHKPLDLGALRRWLREVAALPEAPARGEAEGRERPAASPPQVPAVRAPAPTGP